jgi:hypothetical protein
VRTTPSTKLAERIRPQRKQLRHGQAGKIDVCHAYVTYPLVALSSSVVAAPDVSAAALV